MTPLKFETWSKVEVSQFFFLSNSVIKVRRQADKS